MKIMNIFRIIFASAVVIAVQVDAAPQKVRKEASAAVAQPSVVEIESAVDQVTDEVREDLETATNQAAEQITAATVTKNYVIMAGLEGKMAPAVVKAIVEDQEAFIAQIKQELMQLADNAVAMVDNAEKQASYASQFVTGAQKLGAQVWNPHTEHEKNLARAIIVQLEAQKAQATNLTMIKKLDEQIAEQKVITGDKMSTRQLLLIGAVTAAAAVAGVYLGSSYFAAPVVAQLPEGPLTLSTTEITPSTTGEEQLLQVPTIIPTTKTIENVIADEKHEQEITENVIAAEQARLDQIRLVDRYLKLIEEEAALNEPERLEQKRIEREARKIEREAQKQAARDLAEKQEQETLEQKRIGQAQMPAEADRRALRIKEAQTVFKVKKEAAQKEERAAVDRLYAQLDLSALFIKEQFNGLTEEDRNRMDEIDKSVAEVRRSYEIRIMDARNELQNAGQAAEDEYHRADLKRRFGIVSTP